MRKWFTHNQRGYTLIEVLTGMLISSMVLVLLATSLKFTSVMTEKLGGRMISGQESRRACLFLQKQILKSPKILAEGGRVYLQDMESPDEYLNYYSLDAAGIVFRIKVDKVTLRPIRGGKSQLIHRAASFEMKMEGEHMVRLSMTFLNNESPVDIRFYYPNEVKRE